MTQELSSLVKRLECVTDRLEAVAGNKPSPTESEELAASVLAFDEIISGPFSTYLEKSRAIGGDVNKHADMMDAAMKEQRAFLVIASNSKEPAQNTLMQLLKPTSDQIQAIQDFREKNRVSPFFNHLSALSESIPALGWVTVSPTPAPFIKEMNDAGQFYTNRVLKDWKEKNKTHVEWVKAWVQTLTELQAYVKKYHTTGLVWNTLGKTVKTVTPSTGGVPPPPPPPPPMMDLDLSLPAGDDSQARTALFAELSRGEEVTKGLRKVTPDMQTHKNPNLRSGPAPYKPPAGAQKPVQSVTPAQTVPNKSPVLALDGKKWMVEYQKDNRNMVIEATSMNQTVYMFRCEGSTLQVKGKLNSIVLDSCKKSAVVFETVVAAVEFINCQSVQMQVLGKVPTISVDKTDGCQMYLSQDSLQVEIVSAKSTEMNILVPKEDGDYVEYPIPEQFKTTYNGEKWNTVVVESG